LKITRTDIAVIEAWGVGVASILFSAMYLRLALTLVDIVLIFAVSAVAGALLSDLEIFVMGFFIAFATAIGIAYLGLILPAVMGMAGPAGEELYSAAILMIFGSIFPGPLLFTLLGGFFGNMLGERFSLR